MNDFEKLRGELLNGKNADAVRSAAQSDELKRLAGQFDERELKRAVTEGDAKAMQSLLSRVLATPDGRALAERLRGALGGKP
ncbi:MAG: hypothetical protein LUE97_01725 [Oscillospiraceae bacterium]|nr:hypothetical protein [Oscillospiraceae bacterium]